MELFDEIIQNKQLEDTITERQVLRARKNIGNVCIYGGYSHRQYGRGKEKESTPKRRFRPVSPMKDKITGDRCQTCQKDEINHHSFGFYHSKVWITHLFSLFLLP